MENFARFTLLKFQPTEILLRDPNSHHIYRYEQPADPLVSGEIPEADPIYMNTTPLGPGFIYEKELTTLDKELAKRSVMQVKEFYSQAEIQNTFSPIIDFIARGKHYGAFSPSAILIDNEGSLKLKHPVFKVPGSCYFENDLQAIGFTILQATLLKPPKELLPIIACKRELVQQLTKQGYSLEFIASIWVLLNKIDTLLSFVFNFSNTTVSQQFKMIVEEIKSIQQFNKSQEIRSYKLDLHSQPLKKPKVQLQITPKKNPICIPPLNLRQRQQNQILNIHRKLDLSSKKRASHNQNLNEEVRSTQKKKEDKGKILDGKNMTNQMKIKKSSIASSPLKKKGKTLDKRNQFKM